MTAVSWLARHRWVVGLSSPIASPNDGFVNVFWHADSTVPEVIESTLPWGAPEYPALLVLGIGFRLTTGATVASRRPEVTISNPDGSELVAIASAAQTASLTRRWEFSVGMPFETSLASTTYRECLPRGFLLFPGVGSQGEGQLQILVRNHVTAEDVFGPVTIRGQLLYP